MCWLMLTTDLWIFPGIYDLIDFLTNLPEAIFYCLAFSIIPVLLGCGNVDMGAEMVRKMIK